MMKPKKKRIAFSKIEDEKCIICKAKLNWEYAGRWTASCCDKVYDVYPVVVNIFIYDK